MRLFLMIAAIWTLPAWCASNVPAYCQVKALGTEAGPDAYTLRDGDRCEGTYRLKLSGGSERLSLRSLTSSRSGASLANQPYLRLSWPSLPTGVRLRISVVPLDSPILYRMDTEVDGAAGVFRWPADIARRRFSGYLSLGVLAFYFDHGQTVHVACALGPVSGADVLALRADVLSLESIRDLEVFSRPCRLPGDCGSPEAGPQIGKLLARDRDGTFTLNIASLGPSTSEFYNVRFAGQVTNIDSPPLALSIILRAPPAGLVPGVQR